MQDLSVTAFKDAIILKGTMTLVYTIFLGLFKNLPIFIEKMGEFATICSFERLNTFLIRSLTHLHVQDSTRLIVPINW